MKSNTEMVREIKYSKEFLEKKANKLLKKKAKKEKKKKIRKAKFFSADAFLNSYEWRVVRMQVLKRDGACCACCGATRADGVKMNVDHIKPRKMFPNLALDMNNLQVLCEPCNHGKSNWDQTDWRQMDAANILHFRQL